MNLEVWSDADCTPASFPLDIATPYPDHHEVLKRELVLPTLPSFPAFAGGADRATLLAALSFVEGATTGWMARDLLLWFGAHAELFGWPAPPTSVTDVSIGTIALQPGVRVASERTARLEELPKLLAMARWKVVLTLRGLFTGDDRFLKGAIFAGRVRRAPKASQWLARPRETDLLSDVVLSLFAADVLAYREFHDTSLCVCDVCGRISYNPRATSRSGCSDHIPGTDTTSGVRDRSTADTLPPPSPPPPSTKR
jgi:hypothetical protein